MKFTITNVSETDVQVRLISDLPGLAEIDLPSKIEAGKSASGEIRLLESVLDQKFEKSFTIQLNDEKKSRFTIPVKRSIKTPTAKSVSAPKKVGGFC